MSSLFQTKKKTPKVLKKQLIIVADVVNDNNRTYPLPVVKGMAQYIANHNHMFGQIGYNVDGNVNIGDISHKVINPVLEKNNLYADIEFMPTPMGAILAEGFRLNKNYAVFRPYGYGDIDAFNRIQNYKMISVSAIPRESDSYRGILGSVHKL